MSQKGELPWFLNRLIAQESWVTQFGDAPSATQGLPTAGANNPSNPTAYGFGLMQLDNPPATSRHIWHWQDNLDEGIERLFHMRDRTGTGSGAGALQFWGQQVQQWDDYNDAQAAQGFPTVPPPDDVIYCPVPGDTNCANPMVFSFNPSGDQKTMSDGLWIKMYNGAEAHWMNWNNTDPDLQVPPYWSYRPDPNDYVRKVSTQNMSIYQEGDD